MVHQHSLKKQTSNFFNFSSLSRTLVLYIVFILYLITFIFNFIAFFENWSINIIKDIGSSNIVSWNDITIKLYNLWSYKTKFNTKVIDTIQFDTIAKDDYHMNCYSSANESIILLSFSLLFLLCSMILIIYHLKGIENINDWSQRIKHVYLSIVSLNLVIILLQSISLGTWWFGCYNDIITHSLDIQYTNTNTSISTNTSLSTGFDLILSAVIINVFTLAFLLSYYKRN